MVQLTCDPPRGWTLSHPMGAWWTRLNMVATDVNAATAADAAPPEQHQRKTIAGRYEIDLGAPLGSGGVAMVYPGQDLRTRRPVALKTLRVEYRNDPETRARFRREARLLAFLAHPNVIRVFDFVEDHGTSWVVLERTTGGSLHDLIMERGPLPVPMVARILEQVAAALGHLHAKGLVHLDVTPRNLLLTGEGQIKLIDFGVAQPSGSPQQTVSGRDTGTVAYLAPEQVSGEPVTAATDVYALGCLVSTLLTGQPPFHDVAPELTRNDVIRGQLAHGPTPPTKARPDLHLPPWIDDVLGWAMATDPAERYGSVTSFGGVFRSAVDAERSLDDDPYATTTTVGVSTRGSARGPELAPRLMTMDGGGILTPASRRNGSVRRLYRAGGRALRRAAGPRALLWRTVLVLLVVNVVLALLLFATKGTIPGVYEPAVRLGLGAAAEVVVDDWRIRDAPSLNASTPLWRLDDGDRVAITGDPLPNDGRTWWPVRFDGDEGPISGFVAAEGIAPVRETLWERMRERLPSV